MGYAPSPNATICFGEIPMVNLVLGRLRTNAKEFAFSVFDRGVSNFALGPALFGWDFYLIFQNMRKEIL